MLIRCTVIALSTLPCTRGRAMLQPLPITEREGDPILDDVDSWTSPPPEQGMVAFAGGLSLPTAAVARTRITGSMMEPGAVSLQVKLFAGFRSGHQVVINPGGDTEEHNTFLRPPFVLAQPLRYQHGLGEVVIQLDKRISATASAPIAVETHHSWLTAAAGQKEPPLLGSLTDLNNRSEAFLQLHGRWGIEAAAALVAAAVLAIFAATCIVQVFCEYNPFCFLRRGKVPLVLQQDVPASHHLR
jgi:hypothetical protein